MNDNTNTIFASMNLLRFYRRKADNGKYIGSPYESLVFGEIYGFTVGGNFGYCSLSVDEIAWDLGMSHNSVRNALSNLLKDGFIEIVDKSSQDKTKDTIAYVANMNRLQQLNDEIKHITFDNDPTFVKRPARDYTKKSKREIETKRRR